MIKQLRLLIAEWLLEVSLNLMPKGSSEKQLLEILMLAYCKEVLKKNKKVNHETLSL